MARLDYFDVHDFDLNVQNVTIYGEVTPESLAPLWYQFQAVWASIQQRTGQMSSPAALHPNAPPNATRPAANVPAAGPSTTAPTVPGPISVQELERILAGLASHAQKQKLQQPPTPTAQQMQLLARDGASRHRWLSHIRISWGHQIAARNPNDDGEDGGNGGGDDDEGDADDSDSDANDDGKRGKRGKRRERPRR